MTQTKHQQAQEYAEKKIDYPCPDYGWYESDDEQMKECLADTFKAGAKHVYELPLSERLTAAEKERMRKEYAEILSSATYHKRKMANSNDISNTQFQSRNLEFYVAQLKLLERIFGKDFFQND